MTFPSPPFISLSMFAPETLLPFPSSNLPSIPPPHPSTTLDVPLFFSFPSFPSHPRSFGLSFSSLTLTHPSFLLPSTTINVPLTLSSLSLPLYHHPNISALPPLHSNIPPSLPFTSWPCSLSSLTRWAVIKSLFGPHLSLPSPSRKDSRRGTPRTAREGQGGRWKTWGASKGKLFVANAQPRVSFPRGHIFTMAQDRVGEWRRVVYMCVWGGGG